VPLTHPPNQWSDEHHARLSHVELGKCVVGPCFHSTILGMNGSSSMIPQNAANRQSTARGYWRIPRFDRVLLRAFFRLLYREFAWTYDLVAWLVSLGQWTAWGRAAIPRLRGRRVLELAHGPGHLLVAMSHAGLAPVGADLSLQMGKLARGRARRVGILMPALVRARAQALPFCSGVFDSVVSTFPTEFIFDPATLHEMARVMRPEGQAVVVAGVMFKRSLPARLLKWLYKITDQEGSVLPGIADAVAEAGLTLEHEREPMRMVDVLITIARKR
jgi:ubiquinone/menaquinone biosynthesis C-methylase UbiE